MSMIQCKECGGNISDNTLVCPHCGVQLKKPKRGFFGKLFKWLFILFNLLMVVWLFSYFGLIGESLDTTTTNSAEEAGTLIGGSIGSFFLIMVWALGDIILGLFVLFTRPK